ncbi:MAG: zinc ABC transporter substrate-binding protein [Ruminococcus sp.]|nr:zinc ABC transporter substrate-binding protein [Ruminococcus sp.]
MIDYVRENDVPIVFHIDNSSDSLARTICEDSDAEIKTFYSMHNITSRQAEDGVTFISLLELNLSSIKEALG